MELLMNKDQVFCSQPCLRQMLRPVQESRNSQSVQVAVMTKMGIDTNDSKIYLWFYFISRSNCFSTYYFSSCVHSLLLGSKLPQYKEMVQSLG